MVWRLDRLGRSLTHLITTITALQERQIGFKSITENIDTTTSGGKLIFHIFGALAEFERDIIRERTQAGLRAARARGKTGGRPKVLKDKKVAIAQALYNDKQHSIAEICKTLNISRATLYRYIQIGERQH
jgi:DNA invertase Pin-like site-specific DNA recombinase